MSSYTRVAASEGLESNTETGQNSTASASDNTAAVEIDAPASSSDISRRNTYINRSIAERWQDKLWALAWVTLAYLVARWTNFFHIIFTLDEHSHDDDNDNHKHANRHLMRLAFLCLGINTILALYLTIYLPKFKGLTDASAWPVYCPRIIPSMTAIGVLATFLLMRALWPVYGFLSPLVLAIEFMGFLYSLHFVPWW